MASEIGGYILARELGAGAIGRVFEAADPRTGRRVAIKTLVDAASNAMQRSLLDEAAVVAQLSHPHVVELLDVGRDDAGAVFLVMELVSGTNLRDALARGPDAATLFRFFDEILDALTTAHAQGIVHGDLKPANALVDANGALKVTDFGIARVIDPLRRAEERSIAGTPRYMAPEQLEGRVATPASDQFSFCTALGEALEGAGPPRWLASIVARGLERDPTRRFATMDDLLASARRTLGGSVHVAINGVLQLAMFTFHASITALFLWAMFSEAQGAHATYSPSTERVATVLAWWLAGIFFTGWAPVGVFWTSLNAYGLFRKRRWAITSTLIYCAIAFFTCLGTPIAIYGLVTLWPLRKKIATSR